MAEDLRRFLEDRPIRARRAAAWERAWRWSRRNTAVAGLLAALVVAFLTGCAVVAVEWRRVHQLAEVDSLRLRAQVEIASRLRKGAGVRSGRGLRLWTALDGRGPGRGTPEQPDFARTVRTNLAAWESRVLRPRAILEHPGIVYHARFRLDGRVVVTHAEEKVARLWDVATRQPLAPPLEHPTM